jgi:hypothetical protein
MAPKKPQAKKPSGTHELDEFAEKYETLCAIYQDPMTVVFEVMANTQDDVSPETRLRAAEILMSYRFPKLKALENAPSNAPTMVFNVQMPQMQPPVAIDITPSLPEAK